MEFSDISEKPCAIKTRRKDASYENTKMSNATIGCSKQESNEEGQYEQLRLERKQETRKDCQQEITLKRIHILVYINLVMIIILYIAVITVVVLIAIPTHQADGSWTQWSSWSFCDVTCGNGSQVRFRTCYISPPTKESLHCSGNATDASVCQRPSCPETHVSFFAKVADEGILVQPNQRLTFNKVLNNNMNGYSAATGVFVAPVSGVYMFTYFIEVKNVYGKIDLRLESNLISSAVAYGRLTEITFRMSGINNSMIFEATKPNASIFRNFECTRGSFSISGVRNSMTVQPILDDCPYRDGLAATGGNSALTHVNAGERVWIQASNGNDVLNIRSNGTSFAGILLFKN